MTYVCPKDPSHLSEDADYCSVCGTKIDAVPISASPPAPARINLNAVAQNGPGAVSTDVCPDCGLARHPGARFCEVCRYDFEAHMSAAPAAPAFAPAPVTPDPLPAAAPDPAPLPGAFRRWEAVAVVDSSLYEEPDPAVPCPVGEPDRTFPLDLAESLIGRRSDRRDIHPEVPLTDSGVSHRHAKITRQPDGSLVLVDLGSTNGTELNGKAVLAGVPAPLQDGDQITLGCWTRITIHAS